MPPDLDRAAMLQAEIAQLRDLGLEGLRARWHSIRGRPAPRHLPKHLLFRVLAYGFQAATHGDLDKSTRRFLDQVTGRAARGEMASLPLPTHSIRRVTPGTVLVREWAGVLYHVMALDHGYAWNGTTYRSLSEVARAITGTHWNGPRFFGLPQAGRASRGSDGDHAA